MADGRADDTAGGRRRSVNVREVLNGIFASCGPVANGNITNFTRADKRRVDTFFNLSVEDDITKAREIIETIIQSDQRILKEPKYFIGIESSSNGVVQLVVRAWAMTDEHSDVLYSLNETIFRKLKDSGFHFPVATPAVAPIAKV